MALRRRRDGAESDAAPSVHPRTTRTAEPARELLTLTPRTGLLASAASTAAVLGTAGMHPGIGAAAAAAIVAAIGGKVRGRTLSQWAAMRMSQRRLPDQAALFSRDGVGVVFDGHTATALVVITPRPWQVTDVSATGVSKAPVISADVLRRQLRQFDIGLSRIDVICVGYKFADRDTASGVLDTLIGPVSVPLGGTTVIAVSLDLDADVLGPAYSRARRTSLPDGLCQTLTIASTRVCHSLAEQGFGGRLMSAQQVRDFHDTVLAQVSRPLAEPRWRNCGPTSGVHTRTYVPARGHWNAESAGSWNHLQAHRQYTTLTLTPQGSGLAKAQPLISYLVRGGDALSKAESYGLRVAGGQQVPGVSRALPCAMQTPLRSSGVLIDEHRRLGFGIPAGGAGLFVGSRADKTRVFVAVSPAEEPLWLAGPTLFALQMVARLSTQEHRIVVMIDEPQWQRMVAHRDTPTLSFGDVETAPADVVVCTPAWWERNRSLAGGKAVLLVTDGAAGRGATNSLTVDTSAGRSEVIVTADAQTSRVLWELTPIERRTLIGEDVNADGTVAAPIEGVDLRLGEVVALPGQGPAAGARKIRQAPAPSVATPGLATPDTTAAPAAAPRRPAAAPVAPLRPPTATPQLPPMDPAPPAHPGTSAPRPAEHRRPNPAPDTPLQVPQRGRQANLPRRAVEGPPQPQPRGQEQDRPVQPPPQPPSARPDQRRGQYPPRGQQAGPGRAPFSAPKPLPQGGIPGEDVTPPPPGRHHRRDGDGRR